MSTSRRDFLKTSIIASAGAALPALPAMAATSASPSLHGEAVQMASGAASKPLEFTRGIGLYPGLPSENFSPELVIDSTTYRNLALLRPAYHSSSYDYNLTAQLVTDGIKDTHPPTWVSTAISLRGTLPKSEREIFLDHFHDSSIEIHGGRAYVDVRLGGDTPPAVDRIAVFVVVADTVSPETITFTVSVSDDGHTWKEAGSAPGPKPLAPTNYPPDLSRGTHLLYPSIPLNAGLKARYYRVECAVANARPNDYFGMRWLIGEVEFYAGKERVQIGGPYDFTSAWMSAGLDEEWVYVDLGARCEFDRVALYWIARAAEGKIQISDDAASWRDLQTLPTASGPVDDIKLASPAYARYVRVLMTRPTSPDGYMLSEFEVYGRGGPVAKPKPAQTPHADRRLDLAGGAWRLQRSNLVEAGGEALSKTDFKNENWVVATVPGTVLTSYFNAGAIPDPNFGAEPASHLRLLLLFRLLVSHRIHTASRSRRRERMAQLRRH